MKRIWDEIVKFNDIYFPGWRFRKGAMFFAMALAGEVGELCNSLKKLLGGGTNIVDVTIEDLGEECFDILVYLILFLETIGVDLDHFEEISDRKLRILYKRMEDNQKRNM